MSCSFCLTSSHQFNLFSGKNTRQHSGNNRAAHIVNLYRERYENARKSEKTAIAAQIVQLIHQSHGRFLRWEDDGWVEVDALTARNKVRSFAVLCSAILVT